MVWLLAALLGGTGSAAELRVAVLPFDDAGGSGLEALGVGLQSMITTDLAQADAVDVVERARLQDLLAELELGASGVLDPTTAARVGKLTGATHVVAGSYTVVGGTMRLDARLAEVATGNITVAVDASGERDAFFELEKELVRELLDGLGATLTAKERAAIGRVHTADFGAFSEFSRAVSLYDADRYAEAVAVLERVSAGDADFKLAQVTLADVLAVRDQAEQRAQAATIAAAEQRFVAHQEEAANEARWAEEMWRVAQDPKASWQDRSTAALLLAHGLASGAGRFHGAFSALRASSDGFALRRSGELAYQLAWAELRPRAPGWLPVQTSPNPWFTHRPDAAAVITENRDRWFDGDNPNYALNACALGLRIDEDSLELLWLPEVRRLDARRALLDLLDGCDGLPARQIEDARLELADAYVEAGALGPATELLEQVSNGSTDARRLAQVADRADRIATRQRELEAFPEGSLEREALAFRWPHTSRTTPRDLGTPDRVPFRVHYALRQHLPLHAPIFVGDVPAWNLVRKPFELVTAARTGTDSTSAIRHYRDLRRSGVYGQQAAEGTTLLVVGGVPRADLEFSAKLDFVPAGDWWPRQFAELPAGWSPLPDRPTAGLAFGLTEIETPPVCDPADPTKVASVPTRGWGALIRDGALILARLEEAWPEPEQCGHSQRALQVLEVVEVLASKPMKKDEAEISVRVQGREVTASAGGVSVKATLPSAPAGFPGWFADGLGYVELSAPKLD